MKKYTAKTSAIRAAAKALGVNRSAASVKEVANIVAVEGGFIWEAKKPVVEPAPTPEPTKQKVTKPKGEYVGLTWNRPKPDTKTGRIWELADSLSGDRKAVMAEAAKEGLNLSMAAQQFHRWNHQK